MKNLSNLRYHLGFVNDQPGDRRGFLIGEVPTETTVKVAHSHAARYEIRPIALRTDADRNDIVLVRDIANDFFEYIFQRDKTHQRAIFVDDKREMFAPLPKRVKLI